MSAKQIIQLTFLGIVAMSPIANAHYLWLEPDQNGVNLYYGEAENLLKEKSPGKLDSIKSPKVQILNTEGKVATVQPTRQASYFAIGAKKDVPLILVAEETMEVRDLSKHGLGFAKSNYYARYGQTVADPSKGALLPLDVQTVSRQHSNKLSFAYRGQPLKNAKIEVIAPNTWIQEHKTDAQGAIEINTPWRGQYVVHVLHVDTTPGEFAGKKYDNLRNHLTYTFIKNEGNDPGSAVPPKQMAD